MVSFVPHIVIPGLAALVVLPHERWRILAWAPLAWVPDIDYVIPSEHRALTHTALFPLILVAWLLLLWRRDPTARLSEFVWRPGAPANLSLAVYYLSSHLVLDVFQGGVVLLWPLWDVNLYLEFQLLLDTSTNTLAPSGEAGHHAGAPELSPVYPWLSTRDTAIVVFLGLVALTWWLVRRRTPRPRVVLRAAIQKE